MNDLSFSLRSARTAGSGELAGTALPLMLSGPPARTEDIPEPLFRRRESREQRTEAHSFTRCVNPYLAGLLRKLWLDKRFVRGEGCELIDDEGRRYLDCIAAYGALPFGFNPPEIWDSLMEVQQSGEPSFVQPSLLDAAGELGSWQSACWRWHRLTCAM
jgi:4-aminobutyrate aminotransferase-like enzyme